MKVITYQGPEPKIIPADSVLLAQEGTRCRVEYFGHTRPKEDVAISLEGIHQVVLEGKFISREKLWQAWSEVCAGDSSDFDNLAAKLGLK